jgi:hypothetical protein
MLTTQSGNAYRTVVLPAPSVLSKAAVGRLRAFAAGGGHVIFLGHAPTLLYDRTIKDGSAPQPGELSFATVAEGELPATPTPPAEAPAAAPGPLGVPAAIEAAMAKAIGPREIALDTPDTTVKVLTRRLQDAGVYLFFNEGAAASSHSVTIKTDGKTVEAWDPVSGTVSAVAATPGKGSLTVKLALGPYETRLLMVR